jgi:tRNA A-37 threonylcarbamoyl transferase component Bud32
MYLQHLPDHSRAVLFDRRRCWLIQSREKRVVCQLEWTNSGSKQLFLNFIIDAMNPWIKLLHAACLEFDVKIVDDDAFLGAGATGRVFKVKTKEDKAAALKVVCEHEHISLLWTESNNLQAASKSGVVAAVLKPSTEIEYMDCKGAALLISPVGKPVERSNLKKETVCEIVKSLFTLHSNGFQHGDPRLENLILDGEKYLWIDFMIFLQPLRFGWETDSRILSRSILHLPHDSKLPEEVNRLIMDYSKKRDSDSCERWAEGLWMELTRKT